MADAGWAAVSWPRKYGGRGATPLEQLVYAEETTRARVPVPLNVIGINNIAPAIMQYGTEAQQRFVLYALWAADYADRAERHRAALRVKALWRRLATVGDQGHPVFGGIGFTWSTTLSSTSNAC